MNTPRPRRLADGQLSSLNPPSPSFSLFGAACVMLCCSPASSSTSLRPSLCYPSISLVVNVNRIRIFCGHLHVLYIFDSTYIGLWTGWSSTTRMSPLGVRPPSLSSPDATATPVAGFHHFTPHRHVSARLTPLVYSSAVFLARPKHPFLLSWPCLTYVGNIY